MWVGDGQSEVDKKTEDEITEQQSSRPRVNRSHSHFAHTVTTVIYVYFAPPGMERMHTTVLGDLPNPADSCARWAMCFLSENAPMGRVVVSTHSDHRHRLLGALVLWCRGDVGTTFLQESLAPRSRHLAPAVLGRRLGARTGLVWMFWSEAISKFWEK